jgi:ubiquinone/menaquinone biosynthesis C-methylase UbiE
MNADLDRLRNEYDDRKQRLAGSDIYSFSNPSHLFSVQLRQKAMADIIRKYISSSIADKSVLEIGCGRGGMLIELMQIANDPRKFFGIDLLLDRLKEAMSKLPISFFF